MHSDGQCGRDEESLGALAIAMAPKLFLTRYSYTLFYTFLYVFIRVFLARSLRLSVAPPILLSGRWQESARPSCKGVRQQS